MAYGIRITGLEAARRRFGRPVDSAISAGVKALALEVQGEIAPYPPATIANSPENPRGRWYERGYGPKWWVMGAGARIYLFGRRGARQYQMGLGGAGITQREVTQAARRGMIHGRKTSQMMNRGWSLKPQGRIGWVLGNRATYSGYVHNKDKQAAFHGARGWVTDETAIRRVLGSNVATRIFAQALRNLFGGR